MKRGGVGILGLVAVLSMAAGGWFALRPILNPVPASVYLFPSSRPPTSAAMMRGARAALEERRGRVGRFRIRLIDDVQEPISTGICMGTSEYFLLLGDIQPVPFFVSVVDTHPWDPTGYPRVTPGCDRQGAAAAGWARAARAARAFLLRDPHSLRSSIIARSFQSSARELGMSVDGPADPVEDRNGLVERILGSRADLVFYSGEEAPYVTSYEIFTALREKGFTGPLLMGEADPEVSFLATRPKLVEGSYLVSPFVPLPADSSAFAATRPGPHVTAGYLAMKAILEAVDRANSVDPDELRRVAARLPGFDAAGASTRPCGLYRARNGVFEFVEPLK